MFNYTFSINWLNRATSIIPSNEMRIEDIGHSDWGRTWLNTVVHFRVNRLHWYWQPNHINQETEQIHRIRQHNQSGPSEQHKIHGKKLRQERTDRAWFSFLLRHLARKESKSILSTLDSTRGYQTGELSLVSIGYSKENLKIHTGSPPLPSFPAFPSLSPFPPLEVGPLKSSYRVWGSAVSSPSGLWGGATAESILVHFSLKIWHLVATILTILLRINWPNFIPSPVKWFLKIHNSTLNDAQIDFNDTQFV